MKRKDVLNLSDYNLDKLVKIQGTNYDRKRVLTDKNITKMNKLFNKGMSVKQLSELFNVSVGCVKYNVLPEWRMEYNAKRNGAHTGEDNITSKDRANYKRNLVKYRKIKTKKLVFEGLIK